MYDASLSRWMRAAGLALVALTAACGGGDGAGITAPPPSDPSDPSDPSGPPPQGPAPVGEVIYAVDLRNNFLVFGSGSINMLTAKMRITGLPILNRIIGITIRSDGALVGIGNDSRVYTIDPLTAQATPVSSSPFLPKIAYFFDVHFAMALEPNGQRVRLIAAESGGNWSINLADGAARLDENARYAPGTALEGQTPRLLGLVYPTLPDSAKQAGWCANLAYAVDSDEAIMLASCDPATGKWWPAGVTPDTSAAPASAAVLPSMSVAGSGPKAFEDLKDQLLRCGEFMDGPGGATSPGEREPKDDRFFPHMGPDGPLFVIMSEIGQRQNQVGAVTLIDAKSFGINVIGQVPAEDPIQTALFAKGGLYGPSADSPYQLRQERRPEAQLSVAGGPEPEPSTPPAPSDPRAQCGA